MGTLAMVGSFGSADVRGADRTIGQREGSMEEMSFHRFVTIEAIPARVTPSKTRHAFNMSGLYLVFPGLAAILRPISPLIA
ncbi:MAG: hypothetical protein ABIQ30_09740 [Devosia sp.]